MFLVLPRSLDQLAEVQADFLADSGRLATQGELAAYGWSPSSPAVELREYTHSAGAVRAVVWLPSLSPEVYCTLEMRADGTPPTRTCENLPDKSRAERRAATIYFALLALAILVRFATAGRSHRRLTGESLVPMLALLVVTPVWLELLSPSWCDEMLPLSYAWIAVAGAYLLRNAFRGAYKPPDPPSPRTPHQPRPSP